MLFEETPPIRCAECGLSVDEFELSLEGWRYWSDGSGELIPFCPQCSEPEIAAGLLDRVARARSSRLPSER